MQIKSELLIIGVLLVGSLVTARILEGTDITMLARWMLLHS